MKKIIIVLLCCLSIPWSVEAKDKVIDLKYIPRDKVNVRPKNVPSMKIYFEEVQDTRSQTKVIGENQEDKGKRIKIVTPGDDAAGEFMLSVLKKEFRDKGFKVEDNADGAQKIISAILLKFWTLEDSRYNSETQLRVEVRDKIGEGSFKKTYSSTGTNSGRSLYDVNYNESFSDAVARMVEKIFSDSEFLRFLSEQPKPPRVEEKKIENKRAEEKRLEEKRAIEKQEAEKRTEEKRLELLKAEEIRLEEIRAETKRLEEKRLEEMKAEAKRLEELKAEVKRLEELKAEEKRAKERQEEEKKIEELKTEVKRLEELKALKEEMLAEEKRVEEKKREEEKRAKEKRPAPAKPKPVDPVFGPK